MVVTRERRCRGAVQGHAIAWDKSGRIRSLHGHNTILVLRGGRARIQVQSLGHRVFHRPPPAAQSARFQVQRSALAAAYDRDLESLPIQLPPHALPEDSHAWHLYIIRLSEDTSVGRDELIVRMTEAGIGCSVHFIPLHLQPYWRDTYSLRPSDFPNATEAYSRAVSLPLYTRMTRADQLRVVDAAHRILL